MMYESALLKTDKKKTSLKQRQQKTKSAKCILKDLKRNKTLSGECMYHKRFGRVKTAMCVKFLFINDEVILNYFAFDIFQKVFFYVALYSEEIN